MICAIDFGSCWIRSVFRNPRATERLSLFSEKAEYALIAGTEQHRRILQDQMIPYAECDGTLAIIGSNAEKVAWLRRLPCASLLPEGLVPTDDPPARQMLSLLTEAILPPLNNTRNLCAISVPGVRDQTNRSRRNEEFLCRLVRMQGYHPFVIQPAEAALLVTGNDLGFSGISIVLGAETTSFCLARHGVALATETLAVGTNWIDSELARQFQIQIFDEEGNAYLDIESVRQWKLKAGPNLMHSTGERERLLSRLYAVVLDRLTRTVMAMLSNPNVRNTIQRQRLSIILSGGGSLVDGLVPMLTDRFIEHQISDRVLAIRLARDPLNAVVRGALILGELEANTQFAEEAA
jgi:hypothetical protein